MVGERPSLKQSWVSSDHPIPRLLARPVRLFLSTEAGGGLVLMAATIVALVWANSPFADSYESLWHTELRLSIGGFELAEDLRHWVNDGLMALFFFVVGLEIKRELVAGELNDMRKAALPAFAALGGMLVPALIYVGLNAGGEISGWGVPMATDIAFAVGVMALLGPRVPAGLKLFVLSLAIVDDIGAILVIALFYSGGLQMAWLMAAGLGLALVVVLRQAKVLWVPIYVVIGFGVWLATLESGVHATIAGVALGLLAPARPTDPDGFKDVLERASRLSTEPDAHSLRAISMQSNEVVSIAERLEHMLHPWTSYLIVPVFALANAGVRLSSESLGDAFGSRVTLGIILGLVVGKIVGISLLSWVAVRLGLGALPAAVTWRHLFGGAAIAGIGFTVSLFIAALAFTDPGVVAAAKVGVLAGSLVAGVIGSIILFAGPKTAEADDG